MNLAETFNDPFDPDRSIQLNNKYWPTERYQLLGLLQECEELIIGKRIDSRAVPFIKLRKLIADDVYFEKMLRRLGRILCFQSDFGYVLETVQVEEELLSNIAYMKERNIENAILPKSGNLDKLAETVRKKYLKEYGFDIVAKHKTVRYSGVQVVPDYGPMSDFHNDELKGITCVVYLSDVKRENGAFSFISGSEKIPRSALLTAIHQTVCLDMGMTRPDQMQKLLLEFRGTPIIGNFVEPEKRDILLQNLVVFEGGPGEAIIFNGQQVIHRGGKPESGWRYAAFIAMEGKFVHKIRSYISQVRH